MLEVLAYAVFFVLPLVHHELARNWGSSERSRSV